MRRKKLRKNKRTNQNNIFYLILIFFIYGCENPEVNCIFSNGKDTILKIEQTNLYYRDYQLFKIAVNSSLPHGILQGGFFAYRTNTFYSLIIDKDCEDSYRKGWYSIIEYGKNDGTKINLCDININRIFSTNYKIGDTVSNIVPEYGWCILKNKLWDTNLQDTVFLYEYKTNMKDYTWFCFTCTQGFIGLSTFKKDLNDSVVSIENAYGRIYEDEIKRFYPNATVKKERNFKAKFKDIDIYQIKKFKTIE
jgi:hypothetical protein